MPHLITSQLVEAHQQCPRKAFFILRRSPEPHPHEYEIVIEERAAKRRISYLATFAAANETEPELSKWNVTISIFDLQATCDTVTQGKKRGQQEPHLVIGTKTPTLLDKARLAFAGYALGQESRKRSSFGVIVPFNGAPKRVKLDPLYSGISKTIDILRSWIWKLPPDPPSLIMGKQCLKCEFSTYCHTEAEKCDSLYLLDKMTNKLAGKYQKKGVFTLTQLSYLFKPRRRRKRSSKAPVSFKVELQALALRTGKIYIQQLPELPRQEVELFLDLEGIPDQNFHYLIGLLINAQGDRTYHSFWANTPEDEPQIWNKALAKINEHPEAPIYHYGNYEPRAINDLAQKYKTDCEALKNRLVNLNASIYGKVYFPSRSNNLKELGKLVGASWTAPDASGLQSLVWRHRWEETEESQYKEMLVTYNREDCEALWLLAVELSKIITSADAHVSIDFADRPKQHASELGNKIHNEFQSILRYAHADYNKKRVSIRPQQSTTGTEGKKRGGVKGHQAYQRIAPSKAETVIRVMPKRTCPKHKGESLEKTGKIAEKFIINLRFTKTGCRKTVTKYVGVQGYCRKCWKHYPPPKIKELGSQLFGHAFQAWVIYQRIVLRLPYRIILQEMEDIFNERVSESTLISFISYFAEYYNATEKLLMCRILKSPFVHVDETRINIQGVDHYVWVFTNGTHVVFRVTETRESTLVHELFSDYKGVLISDFYGGYDAVTCRQQKCLVHLIRDLNNDLWDDPYNREYEAFVSEVKHLLVPIFEAEKQYGLKKRHLSKFTKSVHRFYRENIDKAHSNCELIAKYQKRFQRYRDSVFTFLELDGIPWHNNTAENAVRHLAVQRKISGTFFKKVAPQYLLLLGIVQTCRFQDKSLLKFFLSEEIDIDKFKAAKRVKKSFVVVPSTDNRGNDTGFIVESPNNGLHQTAIKSPLVIL